MRTQSSVLENKLVINRLVQKWKLPSKMREKLEYLLDLELLEENNKISLKIENALSGQVFSYGEEFNRTDTIGDMKKQAMKLLESEKQEYLYDFHFYKENRIELSDDKAEVGSVFKDGDVIAVYFNTGNILIK